MQYENKGKKMGSLVSNYIWKNSKNLCATYFADMLLVGSELLKASRSFLSVWVSFFFFNCCLFYSFMCCFTVWLGFQSGSEYMLQSLYLMCKEKNHKSKKHSSVFSNGSLNHSELTLSPSRLQNGSYLALDSSDFCLIYQALSSALRLWPKEISSCSHSLYNLCFSSEAIGLGIRAIQCICRWETNPLFLSDDSLF